MPKHIVISGTSFWNPGDDFVRDGVIRILRNLFPDETVNLHFYNFNADYFPKSKFSGISNEVSLGDLKILAPFVDAVVVAGLSAGDEINDLYHWVIDSGLQDRVYLVGAGYENDYVAMHVDQEPAATIFRNARVITGRTRKTPAFMQDLPYHHINCPAILSVENVKQVATGKSIERIGFSIQLPHGQGVVNQSCDQAMYDLAIDLLAELAPQCQVEIVAHHKSEYFHFLRLFEQHDIDLPVVFSSFYQDMHSVYPRYDLVVSTRLHAGLFANGFGIPAIIINDTDRHTHCMQGFPHVLQATDRLGFAAALDQIQQWDLYAVTEEAAAFKRQLLAEYVRVLAPAFGVAGDVSTASGVSPDYKFDSEQREQLLVRRLVRPGMTVLDVGANIGKYTKLFSLLTGEKGRVFTFEPSHYAFGRLVEDVRRHGCSNVTLINKAVCAQCGTVTLNEFPERYCSWNSMGKPQMENPENPSELVPIARSVDVEALTIDAFCAQQGIDRIDYLKLDVEGAELDALKGTEGMLSRRAVERIQFEISRKMLEGMGRRAREVFEFLDGHGYTCHEITEEGEIGALVDDSESFYANYIAVPSVKRDVQKLPVNFFTIVLNGEPFIRYHIEAFKRLPYRWHWHIIEGVAALSHDTAWSVAQGGRITNALHRNGLSNDGTSEYLDRLAAEYPDNITIYRKPGGVFWDGKLEMVNAPLDYIHEPCLLWQIDADELWTTDQLIRGRELFLNHPDRPAAYYWCDYLVGERLVTTTRDTYGNNSSYEWLRTWRFSPGCRWAAHEPPRLCRKNASGDWVDLAAGPVLTHADTERSGLVFQHFAYVTAAQLSFKEDYYGYHNAVAQWRSLQNVAAYPVMLKDYFEWVTDNTRVDTLEANGVEPLATQDDDGQWYFKYPRRKDSAPRHILWVRTDAIGDNVLASAMLPALRAHYPDSIITVVCQDHIDGLYKNCPHIDKVLGFDAQRFTQDADYRSHFIASLNALQPDLVLNSVYSREPFTDELCLAINAAERITLAGDLSNMTDGVRQTNNAHYSHVIESPDPHKLELDRHRDFLAGIGIDVAALQPCVWTDPTDADFAEEIYRCHGLRPGRTIILAPGAKWDYRVYARYAEVIAPFDNYDLLVVGGPDDVALGDVLCREFRGRSLNLAAQTSLTQTAELMRRCRLVVSSESSCAHLACAVGATNVVVTGGGHFGRFMPYSRLTAVACLPLECYGCNWTCLHDTQHCVSGIDPNVVITAIRHQLQNKQNNPTLFVQDTRAWQPTGSMPVWKMTNSLTKMKGVDIRIVSASNTLGPQATVADVSNLNGNLYPPGQVEALNQQGEQFYLDENIECAKTCFDRALELDPQCATTYNNLAVTYWRLGDPAQAISCLARGMELDPQDRELAINGIQMLHACGEHDRAGDLGRSYLMEFPQDAEIRAMLEYRSVPIDMDKSAQVGTSSKTIASKLVPAIGSIDVKERVLATLTRLTPDMYLTRNLEVFRAAIENSDSWFDSPTFLNWYAAAFKPATYLEVGVRRGRSMAQVVMGSPECCCFGFDMWIPNYSGVDNPGPEFVLRELQGLGARNMPMFIKGNSHETLPAFWTNSANPQLIDLIFIDGDHTYEGAKEDLDLAFPHLADGGALLFDDITHSSHPELYSLWNEYKHRFPQYLFIEDLSGNGTACAFKPPFTKLERYLSEIEGETGVHSALKHDPSTGAMVSDTYNHAPFPISPDAAQIESLPDCREIRQTRTLAAEEANRQGEVLFSTGDIDGARNAFLRALSEDQRNPEIYNNLGVLAWHEIDGRQASEWLAKALSIQPDHRDALMNLAAVMETQDKYQEAFALYESYLVVHPDDPEVIDRIEALRLKGMEPAVKSKNDSQFHMRQGEVNATQLDDDASITDLNEQGEHLFVAGKTTAAREKFIAAYELNPANGTTCNNLAVLAWHTGDLEEAVFYLTHAMDAEPDNSTFVVNAVKLLIDGGCVTDAHTLCVSYLREHPDHQELDQLRRHLDKEMQGTPAGAVTSAQCPTGELALEYREKIRSSHGEVPAFWDLKAELNTAASCGNAMPTGHGGYRAEPLVSAIVSTYNSADMLRECLRDLEQQTIADKLEIIVVDSGSEQNERAIVEEFQCTYNNIVYIRTENRETIYSAWNIGIRAATGRYVTNANTDDAHHPQALEKLVAALESRPDADLAYGNCQWTDRPNQSVGSESAYRTVEYPEFNPGLALLFCILGPHPVWRRSVFERIGYFDPKYHAAGDYEFQMRFIAAGLTAVKVPEVLSTFYQNTEGLTLGSNVSTQEALEITTHYRNVIPLSRLYPLDESDMDALARGWVAQGNLAAEFHCPWIDHVASEPAYAVHCYRKALAITPGNTVAWRNLVALLGRQGDWAECERVLSMAPLNVMTALIDSVRSRKVLEIEHVAGFEGEASPSDCKYSVEGSRQYRANDSCPLSDGTERRRVTVS